MKKLFCIFLFWFSPAAAKDWDKVPPFVGDYFGAAAGSGLVGAAHTAGTLNDYTIGDTAIGMLDSGGGAGNSWARYTLGVIPPGNSGRLINEESSVVNQGPFVPGRDPYNWNPVTNTGLLIDCGNGQPDEHECGTALAIAPNTHPFNNGIVFANGSLEAGAAIGMPAFYYIWWEGSDGSNAWLQFWPNDLHIHSSNLLTLDVAHIKIGAAMAVSCFGPPTPFFQVINGLVTHC